MKNKTHPLVQLAQVAVVKYVSENKIIDPPADLEKEFTERKAGVFVSIKQNGQLRGCIGTYLPTKENIAQEVIVNAISAACDDPRFDLVSIDELASLSYEIYVLDKPEAVKSIDELDPKIYGVIVVGINSRHNGLLLPGLEGVDTVEQQIIIACQKADIDPTSEKLIVQKFRAEKFF